MGAVVSIFKAPFSNLFYYATKIMPGFRAFSLQKRGYLPFFF